jgi:oligosaccharide repeat unit polymerase
LIHPIQITAFFVFITAYIPIKTNFIFQHGYLLFEIPKTYFFKVFSYYVIGLLLSYLTIIIFSHARSTNESYFYENNYLDKYEFKNDLYVSYRFYLLISLMAAFFLIFSNISSLISLNINEFSHNIKQGGNNSIFQLFLIVTLLPAYMFFSELGTNPKKLFALIGFVLVLLILFGSRYPLVVTFLSFIYFGSAFFNIKFGHLIMAASIGISFIILISFFRSDSIASSDQILSLGAYFIRNNDFLYNSSLPLYMRDIGEFDLFLGKTFLEDNLKMYQPSALFPEKELSFMPSRHFYGTYASVDGRTFNFGFFGRAFMDFGIIGFMLLFAIFHYFYNKIFEVLIDQKATKTSSYFIIILLIIRVPMFLLIGLNSHVISLILIDIIVYCLPNFLARK